MNDLREHLINELREKLEILENDEIADKIVFETIYNSRFESNSETNYLILRELRTIKHKIDDIEQARTCPFYLLSENQQMQQNLIMRLLIGSYSNFKTEIKELSEWLVGAEKMIIADPYFFSFNQSKNHRTVSKYTEALTSVLPNKLKEIEIFHLPGPNNKILKGFKSYCRKKDILLKNTSTNEIHDRVWIKDKFDAKVVGTSFGGIGNKIAFILDLPDIDRNDFMKELHKIRNKTLCQTIEKLNAKDIGL